MNEHAAWQLARFAEGADRVGLVWHDRPYTYGQLLRCTEEWADELDACGVKPGDAVGVVGDYSPRSITCLLALLARDCVLVPLARESADQHEQFCRIAELDHLFTLDTQDAHTHMTLPFRAGHALLEQLRSAGDAGLVLFSSGSTGEPKAIVHALPPLLAKFRTLRHCYRTINFLLFDHIGGVNTMFYTLANLGCTVVPEDRSVGAVCRAIAMHGVELLPTSPSFLNLLLLQAAHADYDVSSLKLITYGTEVMPERTLEAANRAFPGARFQQTYGLSEVGILRSKSKSNGSLFVKVGGEDYETKVENGTLRIRAQTSMLGYLNAPSPFDAEGWFDTGDAVIQEAEFYRILGRQSDIINVGGQKVHPTEVEKVLAEVPGVVDVAVRGEPHLLLGHVVTATIQTEEEVSAVEMRRRITEHSRGRLQPYMVPVKVRVVKDSLVNHRFKKVRRA